LDRGKGDSMKKSRYNEEQIVTSEICRQNGISEATFYNWKAN
jgi:hypothetical protein